MQFLLRTMAGYCLTDGGLQITEMFTTFDPKTSKYRPTPRLVSMYPDSLEARDLAAAQEADMSGVLDRMED